MRYIDQFTNYLDRLDPYFAAFEAYLADSFAKFDPVNVFYGVLIAMISLASASWPLGWPINDMYDAILIGILLLLAMIYAASVILRVAKKP